MNICTQKHHTNNWIVCNSKYSPIAQIKSDTFNRGPHPDASTWKSNPQGNGAMLEDSTASKPVANNRFIRHLSPQNSWSHVHHRFGDRVFQLPQVDAPYSLGQFKCHKKALSWTSLKWLYTRYHMRAFRCGWRTNYPHSRLHQDLVTNM